MSVQQIPTDVIPVKCLHKIVLPVPMIKSDGIKYYTSFQRIIQRAVFQFQHTHNTRWYPTDLFWENRGKIIALAQYTAKIGTQFSGSHIKNGQLSRIYIENL